MTDSIGMKFVLIPPGEFDMGSTQEEVDRLLSDTRQRDLPQWYRDRLPGEAPRHRVRITRPFYLGVCEVTQAQYERVMASNPSHFKESGPDAPVEQVSPEDAAEFCRRLSGLAEEKAAEYRLPTEAEWEYACRGGTTTAWCFGDYEVELSDNAWYEENSGMNTHPVGQKKPSPFGLHDVHGNVCEWCQDRYAVDYYADSPPRNPSGATEGSFRLSRGGSWSSRALECRSAFRFRHVPSLQGIYLGFRVARTIGLPDARISGPALRAAEQVERREGFPLVFTENFEQGTDRWETTDDNAWELHEYDGGKAFGLNRRKSDYQPQVRSPHNIALIKDVEVADFVLTVKVKSTGDTGSHRDCCVFFNYQDATHFYYVHLGARADPYSGQIMIVNGAPRVALTQNEKPTPWDDRWHDVKVVRNIKDGMIEIYFDDMNTPHIEAVDKTFGKGRIGIGSYDDMDDFDDIKLYGR